uniref:Uncharacterized protein LOC104215954 n=1 Tax=Nicotiana sylvestris TaxID=4096 RepID=A0A1U7VQN1_NICSY|nr:PREDICTED: uncharacterized protein LOC104215954 [Nicotiana sylvestris]
MLDKFNKWLYHRTDKEEGSLFHKRRIGFIPLLTSGESSMTRKRKAIDFKTTKAYIEKPVTDPLNIQWMVAEILQQKERSLDCGNGCFCGVCLHWRFVNPFSRSYRQYVCGVCLHCVGRYQHRRRYKALIWDYATKKQERWVNQ